MLPHFGYVDGEVPEYARCACGQLVRVDRLDLLHEHREVCAAKLSESAGRSRR